MPNLHTRAGVFLLTVDSLEGYEIVEYYGLVHGKAIYGANFVKDFFARIADKTGGRVGGYEKAMSGAMDQALEDMAQAARKLGANAVLGIDIKTNFAGQSIMAATCTGTAVEIRPRSAA